MQNNYNKEEQAQLLEAGFWVRLVAYFVDVIIVGMGLILVKLPIWMASLIVANPFWDYAILFEFSLFDIMLYLCGVMYFVLMIYYTGSTLGKKLFNLRVVSDTKEEMTWTEVIYRETIGRYLSGLIFGIGYLLIVVDKNKRGLHDRLADTRVIYAKSMKVINVAPAYSYVPPVIHPEQPYGPYASEQVYGTEQSEQTYQSQQTYESGYEERNKMKEEVNREDRRF